MVYIGSAHLVNGLAEMSLYSDWAGEAFLPRYAGLLYFMDLIIRRMAFFRCRITMKKAIGIFLWPLVCALGAAVCKD